MRRFRDLPIRHKLFVLTIATSAVALLVTEGGFLIWDILRFRSDLRLDIEAQSLIVADNSAAPLAFGDDQAANETLAVLAFRPRVTRACLYTDSGLLFAGYRRGDEPGCPTSPPPPSFGWATLEHVAGVNANGARLGTLYIQRDLGDLRDRIRVAALMGMALLIIAGLAAALLAVRINRFISVPLLQLAETAENIRLSPGYARAQVPPTNDEIGVVIRAFNDMVDRIEAHTTALSQTNTELQRASRLKDEFLATLSHELRTPLNAVLGWTQVLRSTDADPQLQTKALESIERNAQIQARLVEDMLEVSRIVQGKLRLDITDFDLADIVDAAVEVVAPAAAAKRIRIERQIVRPAMTSGDSDRLQQVLWNLLSNAVKFTPNGGAVTVRLVRDAPGYRIVVQDTGIGIDPRFLPHLFEPFRQADATPTREHGGLGLGLAIVKHLVELHGGTVSARSGGAGTGATLEVRLPSVVVAPAPAAPQPQAASPAR